tara:strand:+ start:1587 stop:1775 length:189 start_codon:yes stop_codon:yes gene_type:complete
MEYTVGLDILVVVVAEEEVKRKLAVIHLTHTKRNRPVHTILQFFYRIYSLKEKYQHDTRGIA